jgi:hypothetical protein
MLNLSVNELKTIIEGQTRDIGDHELQSLLESEVTSLKSAVDVSGKLTQIISTLSKRNDEIKSIIKESGEDTIIGDYFVATLVAVNKVKISPTKMLKYLKEKDQINLVDAVLDTKITEVRKYLGDIVVDQLGKSINGDSRNLYIKKKL